MAICPRCGGVVTNRYGGGTYYRGMSWHKSCLREHLRQLRRRRIFKKKTLRQLFG